MKSLFSLGLALWLVFGLATAHAEKTTRIEVLYMNHGPLQDTLKKVKNVFSSYGNRLSISWYDFNSREGEQVKVRKGINQHIPLVIWIDDSPVVVLGGRKVQFAGFPTGSGPAFFQGKWNLDDLKAALDQSTGNK
jgi:hypothetical protein